MILLLSFLLAADEVNFYVDPFVCRTTIEIKDTVVQTTKEEDIFYIEFNCGIPYHELSYETVDNKIITKAIVAFNLINLDRLDSLSDTLYRQFTIPSFSQAAKQQISFIVQFGLYIPEGNFRYKISISSGNKKGSVERKITIRKEDYKISDILLASDIVIDTIGNYLRKGNLRVVPHPSFQFSERYINFYIYFEIYDIIPDSSKLSAIYRIKNEDGKIIRQISRQIDKNFRSQAVNLGFNLQGFDPGEYFLGVEVNDPSTQISVKKGTSFNITKKIQEDISYEGLPYYDEIEYFLNASDNKYFQSLPEDGKRMFLTKFWNTHNYYEIANRFEYADEYYYQGNKPGYKTDRGRIYVKCGIPDDKECTVIETKESKPYEYWQYYNGWKFIFVDIRGTNEYTLVWTNARDERSQPSLYKYLPISLLDEIE